MSRGLTPGLRAVNDPCPSVREHVSAADLELIRLFADGLPADVIARRLDVSERTVRRHARSLCDRVGARAPIQLVFWAARQQLI